MADPGLANAYINAFVSYAHENSEFVDRLEDELRVRGIGVWVDRRRLEGGQEWKRAIYAAIDRCSRMVVILSEEAMESK